MRETASSVFAQLMPLLPLEVGVASPDDMDVGLRAQRLERQKFLRQLTDGAQVPEVVLPPNLLAPGVSLREYQRNGLKWLLFLHRFSLHGILCDEMGTLWLVEIRGQKKTGDVQ